jgi:hypothetical protein
MDSTLETIRKEFIDLLRREKIRDASTNWFDLSKLWFAPSTRELFLNILERYCVASLDPLNPRNTVFLAINGIYSPFNTLPLISILANNYSSYYAVWQELGDIVTGAPRIYPPFDKKQNDLNCIIFQGVVSEGTMLQKVSSNIRERGWKVTHFIAAIQIDSDKDKLNDVIKQCSNDWNSQFVFQSIISDVEMQG